MNTLEFNSKVEEIKTLLYGFAMRLTKSHDKAKDLMQETLMRGFKNKGNFRKGTNFKAWMTTIMRNSFINHYRKSKTRWNIETPLEPIIHLAEERPSGDNPDDIILMHEIKKMIACLPDEQEEFFTLFYQGYQYKEISSMFNVPIGTVKSRIYFARKKLQKMLLNRYGNTLGHYRA